MEQRNIESLTPNPTNDRILTKEGADLLLHAMTMGDHSTFLITPEGMIIDGNNRWNLRVDAGWSGKNVYCRVLTYGQDELGYFAIIDGEKVLEAEVIPHHYISVEALYKAYSLIRNGEMAYNDPEAWANKFDTWQLDPTDFHASFFPPKSIADTLKDMEEHEKKKKYQLIIACQDEADMDQKYEQITSLGIQPKRKI